MLMHLTRHKISESEGFREFAYVLGGSVFQSWGSGLRGRFWFSGFRSASLGMFAIAPLCGNDWTQSRPAGPSVRVRR